MHPAAVAAFNDALKVWANPAAAHAAGQAASAAIEEERAFLLSLLRPMAGIKAQETTGDALLFTSSLTEANNMIWRGLKRLKTAPAEIFFSPADHPSLTAVADFYKDDPTIKVRPLPLKQGLVDEEAFYAQLGPQTQLVLLSSVNNTCGVINPVARLSREIKKRAAQAWIHLDHGQGFLKQTLGAHCLDSIALPSSKIGGPGGIAGLWVRDPAALAPWLWGGGHEYGLRASSLSLPLIKAWAAAVRAQQDDLAEEQLGRASKALKQGFKDALQAAAQAVFFPVESASQEDAPEVSPYLLLAVFPQVSSDILMRYLEREDLMVAASSACSSHIAGYSPVLAALGLAEQFHKNVLRFSWAPTTTAAELACVAQRVGFHYKELRRFAGR